MLRSWWRQALVVVLFLLIASCSGSGCSGCTSCGIQPIAGGFNPADTITNAASVRVTKNGLDFLSTNIPGLASKLLGSSSGDAGVGVIDFDVPNTSTSVVGQTLNICPNGANPGGTPPICVAEINLGGAALAINSVTPDAIQLSGTIPVRIQDILVTGSVIILGNITIDLAVGSNLSCNTGRGGVSSGVDYQPFPISVTLPLVAETLAPRVGYMKVDTTNATANVTITSSDIIACCTDTGLLGDICNGLLGVLTGTIASDIGNEINGVVINEIQSQLCTKANSALNPACPIGSHPDTEDGGAPPLPSDGGSVSEPDCVYDTPDSGICVPTELGLEGHIDLGSLLQSISPGASGPIDFVLAANGNMIPAPGGAADQNGNTPNGITVGMLGGGLPSPQSHCVPAAANPAPSGLVDPEPDAHRQRDRLRGRRRPRPRRGARPAVFELLPRERLQ